MLTRSDTTCDHPDTVRQAYERIKAAVSLPSPTGVALHVLELARDKEASMAAIATAVESDPAIAARLLKMVNSPLGGTARKIVSIPRAVALLGVRTVTSLALGFSLASNSRCGAQADFDHDLFWSESLGQGVAARHLAARLRTFAPDEAFTCGLLCQIGRLALASISSEQWSRTPRTSADGGPPSNVTAETSFGIDPYDLAAEMMADWHMPEIFRSAVRAQKDLAAAELEIGSRAYEFAHVLQLAGVVARILPRSTVYRDTVSDLLVQANRLGIAPDAYHEVFDSISREWRNVGAIFSIRTRPVPPLDKIYALAQERQANLEREGPISASLQGWENDIRS
jgi:HD-like signal output (HDOD) protein